MFSPDQYKLLDFGEGRRLEQFGPWRLDRPCPVAQRATKHDPAVWSTAHARFDRTGETTGQWHLFAELPDRWAVAFGALRFELKRTAFGHLGLFPEQAANWDWIAQQVRSAGRPLKVLNLFAYTGGSTLAAAAAGAEVVHVDAARNVVSWARRNAALSGLADAAIHWVAEDAMRFARRETRRSAQYDAVILDPPSYGHGIRGQVWRLSKHLPWLLELCAELTAAHRSFLLLTCHTPKFGPARLTRMLSRALQWDSGGRVQAEAMSIHAATGRHLPSGVVVRWQATSSAEHPASPGQTELSR